jgi:hypothetical protein
MLSEATVHDMCPNCGQWLPLVESTGWCAACTIAHDPTLNVCPCGALFPKKAQVSKCWACRKEEWLTKHADKVEHYLALGFTLTASLTAVKDDVRPICNSCGNPIRGGKEGTRFCRQHPDCRNKAEAYTTLRSKGLSPDVALAIAIGRVTVLR